MVGNGKRLHTRYIDTMHGHTLEVYLDSASPAGLAGGRSVVAGASCENGEKVLMNM